MGAVIEDLEARLERYPKDSLFRADLEVAIDHARSLQAEVDRLGKKLDDRKIIERARGVLMRKFRWSESEAFKRLQRGAMDRRTPMVELGKLVLQGQAVEL